MLKKITLWILFCPIMLIFSLVVGILLGIAGKTVGNFQDMRRYIKEEFNAWRRYPKTHNERYMGKAMYVAQRDRKTQKEVYKIMEEYKKGIRKAHNPFLASFAFVGMFIVLTPFSWVAGMIEGPQKIFEDGFEFFKRKILREPYLNKYQKMVQEKLKGESQ